MSQKNGMTEMRQQVMALHKEMINWDDSGTDMSLEEWLYNAGWRKIRTTNWLTRGMSQEEIERKKREAVEEFEKQIDNQRRADVARAIISDLREALKPLTADRLYDYPRSSYHRLSEIVKELEAKYVAD